jgi:exosortase/archaeosortase family protein
MADAPALPSRGPTAGRAYVGLAVLGGGLAVLLGATPHEDPLVGLALAVFGAALVATAPRLPDIRRLSPAAVAAAGILLVLAVVAHTAWRHHSLNLPKAAIVLVGLALAGCAPPLARDATVPLGRRRVPLATLVACLLPVLAAPLLAWGLQATLKGTLGATPAELFVRTALLPPLAAALGVLGLHPRVQGQTITYATPNGPLSLEVGAACSGVQAMALFAGILALFLLAERPGGRRLALWSCIGLAGVYAANLLRLTLLSLVGYAWGPAALLQAHAQAGWIVFVAWALLFTHLAHRSGAARAA